MATSQPSLAAGRGLVAARITLLNADGSRNCSTADTSAYTMCPQTITISEQTEAGESQTIRCGSGSVYATYTTEDAVNSLELTMTLVPGDIELIGLATGATPLRSGGSIIGWSGGQNTNTIPTEVHAWQESYVGGAQSAAPNNYWHHCWPHVKWRLSPANLEEGFNTISLIGKVSGNLSLGNGSFLDIPVEAFESSTHYHARWRDNDVPVVTDAAYNNGLGGGYIPTPACTS